MPIVVGANVVHYPVAVHAFQVIGIYCKQFIVASVGIALKAKIDKAVKPIIEIVYHSVAEK